MSITQLVKVTGTVMTLIIHLPARTHTVTKWNGIECCENGFELRFHLLVKSGFTERYFKSASPDGMGFIMQSEKQLIWLGQWFSNWL